MDEENSGINRRTLRGGHRNRVRFQPTRKVVLSLSFSGELPPESEEGGGSMRRTTTSSGPSDAKRQPATVGPFCRVGSTVTVANELSVSPEPLQRDKEGVQALETKLG